VSEPTHIGFTGNQIGYDSGQPILEWGRRKTTIAMWLEYLRAKLKSLVAHHGDCEGSDAAFHKQCLKLRIPRVIHPPDRTGKRAMIHQIDELDGKLPPDNYTSLLPMEPYLDRNRAIVDTTALMIAAPRGRAEELRSGTWSTIRYARQARRWIIIVWPDGSWDDEGPRPAWCRIPDGRFEPDEYGHLWDGDHCVQCGFDATDALAWTSTMPDLPKCQEWRV
jgi:hypothetical protein